MIRRKTAPRHPTRRGIADRRRFASTIGRRYERAGHYGYIRMINPHVQDLYERVPIGTQVTVL